MCRFVRNNRFYAPDIGRFISSDPLGMVDGPNTYGFCGGDPVNRSDPMGTYCYINGTKVKVDDANYKEIVADLTPEQKEQFTYYCTLPDNFFSENFRSPKDWTEFMRERIPTSSSKLYAVKVIDRRAVDQEALLRRIRIEEIEINLELRSFSDYQQFVDAGYTPYAYLRDDTVLDNGGISHRNDPNYMIALLALADAERYSRAAGDVFGGSGSLPILSGDRGRDMARQMNLKLPYELRTGNLPYSPGIVLPPSPATGTKVNTENTVPPAPTISKQPLQLTYQPTTHTLSQIRNMRQPAKWKAGEQYVQELYGSAGQRHFPVTGTGGRNVDAPVDLPSGGVFAGEVKTYGQWRTVVGVPQQQTVPLSDPIRQQIQKDVWLRNNVPGYDPRWIFLDAPPSQELLDFLSQNRIVSVTHR